VTCPGPTAVPCAFVVNVVGSAWFGDPAPALCETFQAFVALKKARGLVMW